jgi:MFS family permease
VVNNGRFAAPGLRLLPFVLFAHYALFGAQLGATGVLWSELRTALRLDDGAFGLILLITPLAGFLFLGVSAALRERLDRRVLAMLGLTCSAVGIAGVALAPDLIVLAGARLLCGLGYGLNDAAVMGAALAWERERGRSLVGRLYAGFSAGAIGGALLSGWLLSMGWSYSAILLALAAPGLAMAGVAALSPYGIGMHAVAQQAHSRIPWRGGIIVLAILSLSGALAEALLAGWLVIHLRALGAGPLLAGGVYAGSDVAIILGRLSAPVLQHSLGARRALLVTAGLLGIGAALLLSNSVVGSAAAFLVIGLAVATVAPIVLSLGQDRAPEASDAVARMLLAAGYLGFVIAGPLAGLLASRFGVPAMLIGGMLMVAVLIGTLGYIVRPKQRRSRCFGPTSATRP